MAVQFGPPYPLVESQMEQVVPVQPIEVHVQEPPTEVVSMPISTPATDGVIGLPVPGNDPELR